MRLPRPLRRLLDPHTAVVTGFKSALRAGDSGAIVALMSSHARRLGLRPGDREVLTEVLVGRLDDSVSHEDASAGFVQLAEGLRVRGLSARTWITLENLSRTVGCFVASGAFSRSVFDTIATRGTPAQRFLAAVHQRDLVAATDSWERATRSQPSTPLWTDGGHYLWLWSGGAAGVAQWEEGSAFSELVSGHPVVILGPAPTSLTTKDLTAHTLTARVIMQDVLSWETDSDPLGGACELAYASRETRNWIRQSDAWPALAAFHAVSFRLDQSNAPLPQHSSTVLRAAADPRRLMLGGSSPNMIPLMVWDVLKVKDVSLTLGGTTFFASQTAYTTGNRRFKHTLGRGTDETGSTGELFERCPTFARHNVTENLNLVANLFQGGALVADDDTAKVASMPIDAYLRVLDELYGKDRA
jgi:hypothetical protein